jgi:ribosomal protein S18 acetylase RimI-like enzyme
MPTPTSRSSSWAIGRLDVAGSPDEIRLIDIALLPEYRYAGFGTRLIQALLHEAALTFKPVRIHGESFNPALRLYQRLGFAKIAARSPHWFMEWASRGDAGHPAAPAIT